jgi:hypothetical protein
MVTVDITRNLRIDTGKNRGCSAGSSNLSIVFFSMLSEGISDCATSFG